MVVDDQDVVQAYAEYFRAFQTLEPKTVVPYYHVPCMFISPRGVFVTSSEADAASMLAEMMGGLRARGYARSEWSDLRAQRLSRDTALVATGVTRFAAGGQELERFGATYLLRQTDAGWKIVVLTVHDADTVLALR